MAKYEHKINMMGDMTVNLVNLEQKLNIYSNICVSSTPQLS